MIQICSGFDDLKMPKFKMKHTFKSMTQLKDYIYTKDLRSKQVKEILKGVKVGSVNSMLNQAIKKGNIRLIRKR